MIIKDYSSIDWNDLLIYDETSPSFLRWRKNTYCKSTGLVAGTKFITRGIEYFRLSFAKKMWQVHRVIYCMHFGSIEKSMVVDHIDGNSTNNRISNLRIVTQAENVRNSKKRSDVNLHYQGVIFQTINKNLYAICCVSLGNKKRISKCFGVKRYGLLESFAKACKFRDDQIKNLNDIGIKYTERHGK